MHWQIMQEYPTETRLILVLKEKGQRSLQDLSHDLGISKMGVLNHIKHLESRGLVRRIQKKGRVGYSCIICQCFRAIKFYHI